MRMDKADRKYILKECLYPNSNERMKFTYDESLNLDDINLAEEHLCKKEKRILSMERQKHHKRHLCQALAEHPTYKPSIWCHCIWNEELGKYVYTDRIKRAHGSKTQKRLKKVSRRKVRKYQIDALPRKGNHYRKVFDYWWIWI